MNNRTGMIGIVDSMRSEINTLRANLTATRTALAEAQGECERLRAIVKHVVCDGEGREFYPFNLDGSENLTFKEAAALTSEKGAS